MDTQLIGKTAVVTGASQGLGRAIAIELAREGVQVFATARNEERLVELAAEIEANGGPKPIMFAQDFVAANGAYRIGEEALNALGHVDILINNTGASSPLNLDADDETWEETYNLGFVRHRQLTHYLLPQFIERRQGSILNIVGTYEPRQINGSAIANAGKVVWAKGLSHQIGKYGITVNSLQPGLIDTAQIRRLFPGDARKEYAGEHISLGDFGDPQDVANMAVFLVSPRARYVTGSVVTVDGGMRYHSF